MDIQNRRYLGNKYKLLDFIKETISRECCDVETVFDVFAGTGAVASAFIDKTVYTNDILYSNYLAHVTWFLPMKYDENKLRELIDKYNNVTVDEDNYMSLNFSNTYFDVHTCKKIGYIREDIKKLHEKGYINYKENAILVTSLIYALDKIANTCGHYDAYRKNAEYNINLKLEMPNISDKLSINNRCFNQDANELVKNVSCDVAYLDPPYNSRQYCDAYHLLENIAKWECPSVSGIARKMDRSILKSDYCTNRATLAFENLINNLNCRYILFSYNNTGNTADKRSNAKLTDDDIIRILSLKGHTTIFEKEYKAFTTGKSQKDDNIERLFFCKVN